MSTARSPFTDNSPARPRLRSSSEAHQAAEYSARPSRSSAAYSSSVSLDVDCRDVLLEVLDLRGAGNRQHHWTAPQHPGKRDLTRRRAVCLACDAHGAEA